MATLGNFSRLTYYVVLYQSKVVIVAYQYAFSWFKFYKCSIALTKLDILDNLEELKIAVTYKLHGKALTRYPASDADLSNVEVEYVTLPGWKSCIANVREWKDLPENAKTYVKFIQDYLQVPGKFIPFGTCL